MSGPPKKYSFSREGGGVGEIPIVKPDVSTMGDPIRTIVEADDPAVATAPPAETRPDDRPKDDGAPNVNHDALLPDDTEKPNAESNVAPVKYPRAVGFIVTNEFCERFCFYGMRTILALYLKDKLHYSTDTATIIYHTFIMFVYFFPIFGAMVADSWLGKFRTIVYLSVVYAVGNVVLSVGAIQTLDLPMKTMTVIGLCLIAIGTGGIKPCVSAFGGDQFVMPQQERQLAQFFSLFYFTINAGSFISTFLTPILRADVSCFGEDDCYPLAFGVPAILMVVSLVVFVAGKFLYKIKKPSGNLVLEVSKCMIHAVRRKGALKKTDKRDSWLDYADDEYDKTFIEDIKCTLRVLYLYLPLPMFWALYDQQGSRWTFQATRMNGDIGAFTLKPDQMQVVNPLLILAFVPMFESCIYPLLRRCGALTKQPSRLAVGGMLAAAAFVVSALVEFKLETTYPVFPDRGAGHIFVYNGHDCDVAATSDIPGHADFALGRLGMTRLENLKDTAAKYSVEFDDCDGVARKVDGLRVEGGKTNSYFLTENADGVVRFVDNIDKSDTGYPFVRILVGTPHYYKIELKDTETGEIGVATNTSSPQHQHKIAPSRYAVLLNGVDAYVTDDLKLGGVYTIVVRDATPSTPSRGNTLTVTEPNSVHMLWLLPQYVVMTLGEVMYSVTGLEFSYSQAPASMKSFVTAAWLLTSAFGNLIVILVSEAKIFESQAYEFLLFAGLLFVVMGVFLLMARGYKYVEQPSTASESDEILMKDVKPTKDAAGHVNETFGGDDS